MASPRRGTACLNACLLAFSIRIRKEVGLSDRQVRPLGPDTWDAFAALVEQNNGVWGGCWCVSFHPACAERNVSPDGNRALKEKLVRSGAAHAAVVFEGDQAVGWCQYGPPDELPSIKNRREYLTGLDALPDFAAERAAGVPDVRRLDPVA